MELLNVIDIFKDKYWYLVYNNSINNDVYV